MADALPKELLRNLSWRLGTRRFATPAVIVDAVREYYARLEFEYTWQPDELVLPIRELDLLFQAIVDNCRDDVVKTIRTDDPRGFTAGELLWHVHQTIAEYELGDHRFFEGVYRVKTGAERGGLPLYAVMQGS